MSTAFTFAAALDRATTARQLLEDLQRQSHIAIVAPDTLSRAVDGAAALVRVLERAVAETVPACPKCGLRGDLWTRLSPAVCPECGTRR